MKQKQYNITNYQIGCIDNHNSSTPNHTCCLGNHLVILLHFC